MLGGNVTDQNVVQPLHLGIVLPADICLTCWQVLLSCLLMKIGDVHFAQIPDFVMGYLKNHFGTLRSEMAPFFFIFHPLSFELNLFYNQLIEVFLALDTILVQVA